MNKFLLTLLFLPFKIIGFLFFAALGADQTTEEPSYKSKVTYKPVGQNNEVIQVLENQ